MYGQSSRLLGIAISLCVVCFIFCTDIVAASPGSDKAIARATLFLKAVAGFSRSSALLQEDLSADGYEVAGAAEHHKYMPDRVGVADFFAHVENGAEGVKKTSGK